MFHFRLVEPNDFLPSFIVFLACVGIALTLAIPAYGAEDEFKIHVKKGRKQNYYHMEYVLTADNLIMAKKKSALQLVNDGGQFVVYIKKEAFPVPAPSCNKNIILDMPTTESTRLSALKKIRKKRKLHNELWDVVNGSRKERKVVIELNPYFRIVSQDPLRMELTTCKVYFRTAREAYVDYIGNIK